MTPKILLVDDDSIFRSQFKKYLEDDFFEVTTTDDKAALAMLDEVKPDIVVLDVRMPFKDGLEICREIRRRAEPGLRRMGIIMISGEKKTVLDKVVGLEIGANVYLTKPFEPPELLAQIRALWRLINPVDETQVGWFQVDDNFQINFEKHIVERDGKEIELTKLEFDVLQYLALHANKPRSRSDLARDVWKWQHEVYEVSGDNPINKCIAGLRKKIEPDPNNPRYIEAIYGVGYKLVVSFSSRN